MSTQTELPYGSWPSPITAEALVAGAATPGEVRVDGADVWWSESRPAEGGREQLVRRGVDGNRTDILPDGVSARTRVHEYGGAAWTVHGGVLVYANWADQRLYRLDRGAEHAVPVTPEPSVSHGLRYADLEIVPPGVWGEHAWAVAVRENHEPDVVAAHGEAVNEIVAVPLDGHGAAENPELVRVLVTGPDFVAAPRVAPGGSALAWTQWDHPNMPWDSTELVVARVDVVDPSAGGAPELTGAEVVAGGPGEAVLQPTWAPDGALWFSSDRRGGWWNLHRVGAGGQVEVVAPVDGEIGGPPWVFGMRWFAFLPDGRVACALAQNGLYDLATIDPDRPEDPPQALVTGLTWVDRVAAGPEGGADVVVIGAGPAEEAEPLGIFLPQPHESGVAIGEQPEGDGDWDPDDTEYGVSDLAESREDAGHALLERLRPARESVVGREWFSIPEPIAFPSADGRTSYGILYRPRNPEVRAPEGTLPPLLVSTHGGPTAMSRAMLTLGNQYWTTRGFAVIEVNYGGSTGYGRPYRELLRNAWGVVDVQDTDAAARYLAGTGVVDPDKLAIRGGSAGGFTTLAALAFGDTFAAGANHFGVADLAALARDTHKFESRYLDGLVGPYPEAADRYKELSPISHTDAFTCPLAVFQGLEDEVVPPAQSEMIVEAVRAKGLPYVYLAFEGEQHGFRKAENIIRTREAELWFFGKVFGFEPADAIEPPPGGGF